MYTQYGGSIVGFNAQNGALIWNHTNANLWTISQPVVTDGVLYIGYSDGQIYALRTPTLDIQVDNLGKSFLMENQNTALLIVIVVVLFSAIITLTLVCRNKRSKGKEQDH